MTNPNTELDPFWGDLERAVDTLELQLNWDNEIEQWQINEVVRQLRLKYDFNTGRKYRPSLESLVHLLPHHSVEE